MKIALVYDMAYPFNVGGVEIRNFNLGQELKANNEVHLFCVKLWDGSDVIEQNGLYYHGVCHYRSLHNFSGQRTIWEPIKFSLAVAWSLMWEKLDLISVDTFPYFHCFTIPPIALVKRVPVVFVWHGFLDRFWQEYLPGWQGKIARLVEKTAIIFGRRHIAVSDTVKKMIEKSVAGNAFVSNNAYDPKIFNETGAEKIYDVVFVGRLCQQKNLPLFVRSLSILKEKMPNFRACLVGDGPDRRLIEGQISQFSLGENVAMVGEKSQTEIARHLNQSKILVLTSRWEGFGMVAIEAMACGLPVVTVNEELNSTQEFVKTNKGLVVDPTPEAVAQAIYHILSDDCLHKNMSEKAMTFARDFLWARIARELEKSYNQLIAKNK